MMSNPMIKWGLYYGLANIAFTIISYFLSKDLLFGNTAAIIISLALAVGAVVMVMKEVRTEQEGYLGFGEAMKVGLGVFVMGILLSSIFQWVLYNFIDTSLIQESKDYAIEAALAMSEKVGDLVNLPEEQMEEMMAEAEKKVNEIGNPMALGEVVKSWFLVSLIGGLPLNLIISAIMKKS